MMFDSDVLIWATRGDVEAAEVINSVADRAASVVTVMEIVQGARSKTDLREIRYFLRSLGFREMPLNEKIGSIASTLIDEHALSSGLRIEDALIAATAIDAGEVLATGNLRHFRHLRNLALKPFRPRRHRPRR